MENVDFTESCRRGYESNSQQRVRKQCWFKNDPGEVNKMSFSLRVTHKQGT